MIYHIQKYGSLSTFDYAIFLKNINRCSSNRQSTLNVEARSNSIARSDNLIG